MTGDEFKTICALAKLRLDLDQAQMSARLGIGKTKYHELRKLRNGQIDKDVEQKILADPELAALRTIFHIPDKSSEQLSDSEPDKYHPSDQLMAKSLNMINDTLLLVKSALETIKDDNRHIKKTSDFHQSILEAAHKDGHLMLIAKKK